MPAFRCQPLGELTRQLTFSPRAQRRRQIDRAERLYWQLDDQANYPLDHIIYEITRHRPYLTHEPVTLVGQAVRQDLLLLVEQLSASLDDRPKDFEPPPLDLPALARRWNVSTRTISRYRRAGLFARRLLYPNRRRRLAFLHDSIERFEQHQPDLLQRASRFERLDPSARQRILELAARLAGSHPNAPYRVIRQVARQTGRSIEVVRLIVRQHDRQAQQPLFPHHHQPLQPDQQQAIFQAYHQGCPVAELARRYHRAPDAIYRAIHHRHAAALRRLRIDCIANPTFDRPDAQQVILACPIALPPLPHAHRPPAQSSSPAPSKPASPSDLPAPLLAYLDRPLPDAPAEQALFVRYNFLKHLARLWRSRLDRYRPRFADLDRIETALRHAAALRHRLSRLYLPLVLVAARKHLATPSPTRRPDLLELAFLGHRTALQAIDHFDVARGRRFETYLNWQLLRTFAADRRWDQPALSARTQPEPAVWPAVFNPDLLTLLQAPRTADLLEQLLDRLDPLHRRLLCEHLGLPQDGDCPTPPATLAELAGRLDLRPAVARRLERQARLQLLHAARQLQVELNHWLPSPAW